MNSSKQPQQQTTSKKQSPAVQRAAPNSPPSTPNSRKPVRRGNGNKKRNSNSYTNGTPKAADFLSFQPALQDCFVTPQSNHQRRSSPREVPSYPKYSNQVNGYNNSLSPLKLSSPAIAPLLRQAPTPQGSGRRQQQRTSPNTLFKQTPFAGAKYLEMPSIKDLPLPPAWLIDGTSPSSTSTNSSESSSPITIVEPSSPSTEAAVKVATENGFDGRIRISPLQLIAAVSSA